MKGVILAGGNGNRLSPFTKVINKSILPIYDEPTIYFSILSMINFGISEIIINTKKPEQMQNVLSEYKFEADICYHVEKEARGVAAALYDMREKIKDNSVLAMLGDIYLPFSIKSPDRNDDCCVYLSSEFNHSRISEYGVAQLNQKGEVLNFEEKPEKPVGNLAHMGITFFPNDLISILESMEVLRGKDLTDIANIYHGLNRLFGQEYNEPWFNVGTPEDLFLAAQYRRQSLRKSSGFE